MRYDEINSQGFNRSIPVMAGIRESKTKAGGESLVVQMVRQAGKVVEMMGKPSVLLSDACFFSKTILITAAECIGKNGLYFSIVLGIQF